MPCRFKNEVDGFIWVFEDYGLSSRSGRELFWEELGVVQGLLGETLTWSDSLMGEMCQVG